ncbi:hypothetical protein PCANC_15157 [Puccinia coronata f. sp. avenae]|uniref:Phosphoglycerate mutase (2,3-diphosphoglycerate-dependent) n=1 Tax=Puccinia coronata f. sp. avenae TaxID=200324 RepID=A0A2N5TFY1_9BASI|nr:hypothetical protein PCASD_08371 [Puccinia coronata f. sp. avenae]PLW37906.1 hypothetical protein PCANC_15157 [Puccinia coronata f. sp. avenae]PLW42964.1 hypothetical protein PCASD_04700 [Puccinia coronata f. sp. avenae]
MLHTLTLTLVRHGESTDNIIPIWAGHRDATLTNHGHAQAQRLGDSLKNHRFHRIFCSDLKRAHLTANQICIQNLKNPVPPKGQDQNEENQLVVLPLLREQNFGEAEGERWDSGRCTYEGFYSNKALKFKNGESREDVQARAEEFVRSIIDPTWTSLLHQHYPDQVTSSGEEKEGEGVHLCIVSHGIFLTELIQVLKTLNRFQPHPHHATSLEHFANTGWERIQLTRNFLDRLVPEEYVRFHTLASNVTDHLNNLSRQPGGIGNAPWDPKQSNLDAFLTRPN